ncbi:hypothetical protein LguiB_009036 [Lonicera macranthoides]
MAFELSLFCTSALPPSRWLRKKKLHTLQILVADLKLMDGGVLLMMDHGYRYFLDKHTKLREREREIM